jgi:sulfur carrier protein ThiS
MAHFAKVENGIVTNVIVVSNDDAPTETTGQDFLASIGLTGEWVQTSYNNNPIEGASRGKYAGIGDTWNGTEFVAPIVEEPIEP